MMMTCIRVRRYHLEKARASPEGSNVREDDCVAELRYWPKEADGCRNFGIENAKEQIGIRVVKDIGSSKNTTNAIQTKPDVEKLDAEQVERLPRDLIGGESDKLNDQLLSKLEVTIKMIQMFLVRRDSKNLNIHPLLVLSAYLPWRVLSHIILERRSLRKDIKRAIDRRLLMKTSDKAFHNYHLPSGPWTKSRHIMKNLAWENSDIGALCSRNIPNGFHINRRQT